MDVSSNLHRFHDVARATRNRLTLHDVRVHISPCVAPSSRPSEPPSMPPRTLANLAHALTVSDSQDAALQALGEALVEMDRMAQLALIRFDERRGMLRDRVTVSDRKSTRLNSSHVAISYAVFCLKKTNKD